MKILDPIRESVREESRENKKRGKRGNKKFIGKKLTGDAGIPEIEESKVDFVLNSNLWNI